ncbi:MAG: elongation factor G [Desulfuromonas sp.]|nr:MAG: elongation factor G [Desulfuromonas sp.]
MSATPPDNLRNIGIISHIDAGKTTVSERILFFSGEIHRMGEVHDGTATMDWMDQEQERGITITATSTTCHWKEWQLNLIDTPGHIDFTIEVERSLRALDGAVAIFSAVEGVQPQSESVWRQAERYHVPRICLINKLDRIGADHRRVLEQMRDRLQAPTVLLQLPIGFESEFCGVIDLIEEAALYFIEDDQGLSIKRDEIPAALADEAHAAREELLEAAADFDDALLDDLLEGRPLEPQNLRRALRQGTLENRIFPVLLGSALRNKGMEPLLDAIGEFLPSPRDTPPIAAHNPLAPDDNQQLSCRDDGPLCALAFKVISDEGRKLTYLRLYSGILRAGAPIHNHRTGQSEKLARLFRMHAHRRERIDQAHAGDIVAAAGLRDALTGDTFSHPEQPLQLAGLSIPEPVVSLAVEPRGVSDRDKLMPALDKLQWEDPTFKVHEDPETGQTILTGMGELHLEVMLERLHRDFNLEVNSGRPQVVYRETLTHASSHHERFDREIDGKLQSAELHLLLQPGKRGAGIQLEIAQNEETPLAEELLQTLEESLLQACNGGVCAGYPLTDLVVKITEIGFDPTQSSIVALRAAAQRGVALAAQQGAPTLLEPVMSLELIVPSEYSGKVYGSLQQKRGRVEGSETCGEQDIIAARVPLVEMFGYMTELRSATKGRGSFSMEFSHFDQAPPETLQRFGL